MRQRVSVLIIKQNLYVYTVYVDVCIHKVGTVQYSTYTHMGYNGLVAEHERFASCNDCIEKYLHIRATSTSNSWEKQLLRVSHFKVQDGYN